jgi:Na+/melibiose symporter-like transporter
MLPSKLRDAWRALRLRTAPRGLSQKQRRNFLYTQIDALGVGLAMAMDPFLPVFLARLGASNQQIGLLSAIPGISGLALGLVMARFLERRRSVVPWYSGARLIRLLGYGSIGVVSMLLPPRYAVAAILILWLLLSIPSSLLSVAYSVLMNAVAGPEGRYALLSRRWSIIGITGAVMTIVAGQILNRLPFPLNYEVSFIGFAVAGAVISFVFSRRIEIPKAPPPPADPTSGSSLVRARSFVKHILAERRFVAIVGKRLVYIMGSQLVMPLFALWYVYVLDATDAQISLIAMTQKAILLLGYFLWTRLREVQGSRFVLLSTTLVMALYPALTAMTQRVGWMIVLAGVGSIFQAGVNLVFFDELMKTVPLTESPTFVAVDQTLENSLAIVGPLISTSLIAIIGLSGALYLGAAFRLAGFVLFWLGGEKPGKRKKVDESTG